MIARWCTHPAELDPVEELRRSIDWRTSSLTHCKNVFHNMVHAATLSSNDTKDLAHWRIETFRSKRNLARYALNYSKKGWFLKQGRFYSPTEHDNSYWNEQVRNLPKYQSSY